VAGIPWGKYDKADWRRVPGGARRYYNVQNPDVTISRRQYDEHYGAVKFFGTNERKARLNAQQPGQLLKPARGRSSALKLSPSEKEAELNRRKVSRQEQQKDKLVSKLSSKKNKLPTKITLKNFRPKTQIRKFRTGVNQKEIEGLRLAAYKSRIVFGYWVGLEIVSERDGKVKTPSLFTQRDIAIPFTEADLYKAVENAQVLSYAQITGMWIAFHLTKAAAIKNGARTT
jgi:hypothetical protein